MPNNFSQVYNTRNIYIRAYCLVLIPNTSTQYLFSFNNYRNILPFLLLDLHLKTKCI